MQEVEVKILDVDVKAVQQKLADLGARKVFDGELDIAIFDTEDNQIRKAKSLLRLRSDGEKTVLCHKRLITKQGAKIMDENEVEVQDKERAKLVLQSLGYTKIRTQTKHRTSYLLGEVRYELDTLPGIPTFLEIEAKDVQTLQKAVKQLGYAPQDTKPWTGGEVLEHYEKH
ncbi:MAG: class IV adenylate cyclase [Candidatus Woesearchaeota archaeon]|jgi:adenylate cyclase class 2|nr:class IV adenylate cyclase [Candidatus Woesearchaeota archaeon]MDP7181433.1 class IV adenylate cyclase [Candidatus Woesearchaeota archaeon]MDP7198475.1 class IV adenylate cyclase [Candidatus Woesearchaeota archaeon]MDP7466783.1 class IV adenylate cyclase [Candidatus Woesearchaeota archaeon]MDP7648008.1 class IV adenylate cyclase [Candidatus Woesearchaeota archaeon]|tara:strand:- start:447 stop:959 length:513 start_codon:yes stop_codon:yes gene_type:complete